MFCISCRRWGAGGERLCPLPPWAGRAQRRVGFVIHPDKSAEGGDRRPGGLQARMYTQGLCPVCPGRGPPQTTLLAGAHAPSSRSWGAEGCFHCHISFSDSNSCTDKSPWDDTGVAWGLLGLCLRARHNVCSDICPGPGPAGSPEPQ